MSSSRPKVVVLGASGLLGRAVMAELIADGSFNVVGTAYSRGGQLVKVDVTDKEALTQFLTQEAPRVVVNCVAERRPDVVEQDPVKTHQLNVEAVETMARAAAAGNFWLLSLSTDYVFDGTSHPYKPSDQPNPLNSYGKSKLDSEEVVRSLLTDAGILRVPVLYGPAEGLDESAILIIAKDVLAHDRPKAVDDYSARYPTHTGDVAVVIRQMIHHRLEVDPSFHGTWHWSSKGVVSETGVPYTKYSIAQLMGQVLGLPTDHLTPDPNPPKGAPRPKNCELDITALQALGFGRETPLRQGLAALLPSLTSAS